MQERQCVRAHVLIRGRVQGVGFRAFTQSQATRHGLNGWVRNLPDGRVETEIEGARTRVDECIQALRHGSPLAHVQDVQVEWLDPNARESAFEILD